MPRPLQALLRVLAALALLALAVWLVGWERLEQPLRSVDLRWFGAACLCAAAAQGVSVLRWETIARIFGLRTRTRALAAAYAQGMTLNVLLPGATLGGDALRSLRLQSLGNPLGVSALTVLLDRLSGLWVLCVLSLATGLALAALMAAGTVPVARIAGLAPTLLPAAYLAYLAGLLFACVLPFLPFRPRAAGAPAGGRIASALARAWGRLVELHALAVAQKSPLLRSMWSSVLVQVLSAGTLWLCLQAAGGDAGYWRVQVVAAPVFVAGALPISYGGFGAREIAALAAFPLAGVPAGQGLAASALYGLVAVVLGLAAAPAFAARAHREEGET